MNIHSLNSQNNDQQESFGDKIKKFWSNIPLVVKSIISLTLFFYILSWITSFVKYLMNFPQMTIFDFHLWSVFTSVVVTPSILNVVFAFIAWVPDAIKIETQVGSVRYFMNFMINSTIIQILYLIFALLFWLIFNIEYFLQMPSAGLWPLIMSEITILCNANPDSEVRFFLCPFPVKSKYYPWALLAFFAVLNFGRIQFDLFCGVGYGYLFSLWLKNYLLFSNESIESWESSIVFKCCRLSSSFVPVANSIANQGFSVQRPQMQGNNTQTQTNVSRPDRKEVKIKYLFRNKHL